MARVLGGLGHDVDEDPPGRTARARFEPRCLGQRVGGVEVDGPDQFVGRGCHRLVVGQHTRERLLGQQRELPLPLGPVEVLADRHRRRPLHHEARPLRLGGRDVLDEPAEGELADRGTLARLVVGEAPHGGAEEEALHGQGFQQVGALAARRGHGAEASTASGSSRSAPGVRRQHDVEPDP